MINDNLCGMSPLGNDFYKQKVRLKLCILIKNDVLKDFLILKGHEITSFKKCDKVIFQNTTKRLKKYIKNQILFIPQIWILRCGII